MALIPLTRRCLDLLDIVQARALPHRAQPRGIKASGAAMPRARVRRWPARVSRWRGELPLPRL